MMLIELFAPKNALSPEQRRRVAERLVTEVMTEESAPPAVTAASLAISHVVVHEPDTWLVGGRPVESTEAPRYLVRVTVPNAWRKEMSEHVISRVTRVLAEVDGDRHRLYREPHAWVHVVGVPEGSMGSFGHVMDSSDIVKLITKSFRSSGALTPDPAPGTAIDPICGMTVPLTDATITIEHDGTRYAFCSAACRRVFADEQGGR
jgi:YHS domain-containing protein/phenylpyruvate tautomerase PptA (4-oxalocrotonate tautomerase family)